MRWRSRGLVLVHRRPSSQRSEPQVQDSYGPDPKPTPSQRRRITRGRTCCPAVVVHVTVHLILEIPVVRAITPTSCVSGGVKYVIEHAWHTKRGVRAYDMRGNLP